MESRHVAFRASIMRLLELASQMRFGRATASHVRQGLLDRANSIALMHDDLRAGTY